MTTASINRADLYYEVQGSGEPIFLTHGAWGDATAWDGVVPGLAQRFEVITWDRRGHTRSAGNEGDGSYIQDALDLAGLIEYHGRTPAHVYGTSSGGTIVMKLMAARPDLLASAAAHECAVTGLLAGTTDPVILREVEEEEQHLGRVRRLAEAGAERACAEYFIDNVAVGPGAWDRYPESAKAGYAANTMTFVGEMSYPDNFAIDTDAVTAAGVPLLMTRGTESPSLILAAMDELVRRLPNSTVVTMEGAGHVPYRTHPDLWLETLFAFQDGLRAATL